MTSNVLNQIKSAYGAMAKKARYRPSAPSDGLGNITVADEDLNLEQESETYARQWWKEEDGFYFAIGCCNYCTRPATIFAVEAARLMCGGRAGNSHAHALKLLKMAVKELEAAQ